MFVRFVAAALLLAGALPARAVILLVNNPADSGNSTLRAALAALPATGDHYVVFNLPANATIPVASPLPDIRGTGTVYFDASGAPGLTVAAQNATRIFRMRAGTSAQVTLRQFRVTGGVATFDGVFTQVGGGCFYDPPPVRPARVTLDRMVFENCTATNANGASDIVGGAVKTSAPLRIVDSTFVGNVVVADGTSGYARGGAVYAVGPLEIVRSSFVGNEATGASAAGSAAYGVTSIAIERSAFVGNVASGSPQAQLAAVVCIDGDGCAIRDSSFRSNVGGALWSFQFALAIANTSFVDTSGRPAVRAILRPGTSRFENLSFLKRVGGAPAQPEHIELIAEQGESPQVAVANSLFGPTGSANAACAIGAGVVVAGGGWNLATDASCDPVGNGTGGVVAGDAGMLAPVATPGSTPAEVVPLAPTSPAIDFGSPGVPGVDPDACLPLDASGASRPQDGDGDGWTGCDVGAYERPEERVFADGFEG